jgi:hypothetical protein
VPYLDRFTVDCDEGRFALYARDEYGNEFVAAIDDVDAARAALRAVLEPLDEYAAERDRERAAYDRATPDERDAVLGRAEPEPDEWDAARIRADIDRKRLKGE